MAQTAATLAELAQQFDVHPQPDHTMEGPTSGKGGGAQAGRSAPALDLKALHAKFGELTLENDFLEGALGKAGMLSAKR
jgi:transposase